jgi:hypothetical protein
MAHLPIVEFISEISEICIYKCAVYDKDVTFKGSVLEKLLNKYKLSRWVGARIDGDTFIDRIMEYCNKFNEKILSITNNVDEYNICYEEDNLYETEVPELAIDAKWLIEELAVLILDDYIKSHKGEFTSNIINLELPDNLEDLYEYLLDFRYKKNIIHSNIEVAFRIFNFLLEKEEFPIILDLAKKYAELITFENMKDQVECLCPACHICYHDGFKCICEA